MKRALPWLIWICCLTPLLRAQEVEVEEIIRSFAEKEEEFRRLWQEYTYRQNILFQVLDELGYPREQQKLLVEVYFDSKGRRRSRVLKKEGKLVSVGISPEDMEDALENQPFVLTTKQLPHYEIRYRGTERVDELDTYVFDVAPRRRRKGRYFEGRIWVDQQDLQIVLSRGKIVPDHPHNKFPRFEVVRQQVDGHYWFPVWIEADDVLVFPDPLFGQNKIRVRQLITFEDFQRFEVDTSIRYEPVPP